MPIKWKKTFQLVSAITCTAMSSFALDAAFKTPPSLDRLIAYQEIDLHTPSEAIRNAKRVIAATVKDQDSGNGNMHVAQLERDQLKVEVEIGQLRKQMFKKERASSQKVARRQIVAEPKSVAHIQVQKDLNNQLTGKVQFSAPKMDIQNPNMPELKGEVVVLDIHDRFDANLGHKAKDWSLPSWEKQLAEIKVDGDKTITEKLTQLAEEKPAEVVAEIKEDEVKGTLAAVRPVPTVDENSQNMQTGAVPATSANENVDTQNETNAEVPSLEEIQEEELAPTNVERPAAIPQQGNVSATVQESIKRAMQTMPTRPVNIQPEKIEPEEDTQEMVAFEYPKAPAQSEIALNMATQGESEQKVQDSKAPGEGFLANQEERAQVIVSPSLIDLVKGESEPLKGFEVSPDYNKSLRKDDNGKGKVVLSMRPSEGRAVVRTRVFSTDTLVTRVDLSFLYGSTEVQVPVFEKSSFDAFVADKVPDYQFGGHLLVKFGDGIETVNIDKDYLKAIFLDSNLKETENQQDAEYVLFLGVVPGNVLLSSSGVKGQRPLDKIVAVFSEDLSFEHLGFSAPEEQQIEMQEMNLFGSSHSGLSISENEMSLFNRKTNMQQIGQNAFQFERPALPLGMRRLIELKHLQDTVYLGSWDLDKLTVPSADTISQILRYNEMDELTGQCLAQINFRKGVHKFSFEGEGAGGTFPVQARFLDKDGQVYQEETETVKNAFLTSNDAGVINVRVDYVDSTSDAFTTYCSLGTLIVEQL